MKRSAVSMSKVEYAMAAQAGVIFVIVILLLLA